MKTQSDYSNTSRYATSGYAYIADTPILIAEWSYYLPFIHQTKIKIKKQQHFIVIKEYSDNFIKNTVLRPNWQYKASTAKMA